MTRRRRSPHTELSALYENRFSPSDLDYKRRLWAVLCRDYFQSLIGRDDVVLDLGAGTCEFINSIACRRKLVVDLNPAVTEFVEDAEVFIAPGTDMDGIDDATVDVVFCSNFFEHMKSKDEVVRTIEECRRVLVPGGRIVILQPNIRYLPGRYWDYFDHHVPLTHLSMQEALGLGGFLTETAIGRFLPYTVKSKLVPRSLLLVRVYLKLRFLWPLFGRQMLLVGRRA